MLTVLSFFAREESKSVSENIKWRYKRKFEQMEERQENDNSLVQYKAKQFIRILADVGKNTVLHPHQMERMQYHGAVDPWYWDRTASPHRITPVVYCILVVFVFQYAIGL
ncbi:MAG: hypothetical protein H6Q66_3035 [Firmicutes bacterium]|nr:hypothetical protein [Bacillota bacterium]